MPHLSPEEIAFPELNDQQIDLVKSLGETQDFHEGDALISVGQKDYPFCVILSGEVRIVDSSSGKDRHVISHGAGGFIGDVDILTGRPAVISAVAACATRACVVPATHARSLLNEVPDLSDMLLDAFQMRRRLLQETEFLGTRVIGRAYTKETARIREFFYKNHVPHTFFDVEDEDGKNQLAELNASIHEVPVVACSGRVTKQPSIEKVAECMGISRDVDRDRFDLAIVGAGPAGLAASVYAASEGLKTLVIDRVGPGGQAGSSSKIENFIGFPSGLSGADLANRGYLQALKFGAQFIAPVAVRSVEQDGNGDQLLHLCTGQTTRAKCVLGATGVTYRQLDIAGCREFEGAGVYYAATSVEARVCRNSTAVIVGGGNSAGQAAMYLANHAKRVLVLIRGDDLGKRMSSYLSHRVEQHDRVEVMRNTEVAEICGESHVDHVRLKNNITEEETVIGCSAVCIFVGAKPHTDWFPDDVARDDKGFVLTGSAMQNAVEWNLDRTPCDLETSVPGILAAGDVRSGTTKRCGFAVGDGSLAVTCVHRYLNSL